jgi:hypothetical protein
MDNHPVQNYSMLATAIVLAAVILGAASFGALSSRTTITSISTENSTATSTLTDTLTRTTTLTQTLSSGTSAFSTTISPINQTFTLPTTSSLTVDSVDQNGTTIAGHYTVLDGPVGSMVLAEGITPVELAITVGQTYFVRAESYGGCTFTGWSDKGMSDPRAFNATSTPVSYTAAYDCSNVSAASPIVQSCTGYFPITGTMNQTLTQTPSSSITVSTTTTAGVTTTGNITGTVQAVSCRMGDDVRAGDLIVVKVSDLPGVSLTDSMGNSFTLLEMDRVSSTYYNFIYYAIATSSGPDTLTVRGYGNFPSIMTTELQGLHTISGYETGTGNSTVASVSAFTPPPGSFVMSLVEPLGPPISVSPGAGYTLAALYAVSNACEYGTVTGPTTSSFTLGTPAVWEEVSLVFS